MVYQTMQFWNKTNSKALRQEIVDWIMKNSNVRQSPINRDTLLIADAYTKVNVGCQNFYWNVPCDSSTMSSLLHLMMEV